MEKRILLLTLSLLSLDTFAAESAEAQSTGELLRTEHAELYINPAASLQEQIALVLEGIESLNGKIDGLTGTDKDTYLQLLSLPKEDTAKKVTNILKKLLFSEKARLEALQLQLMQTAPENAQKKPLSLIAERKAKAKELRAASAAAATPIPQAQVYKFSEYETGITLEKDGRIKVAISSIFDHKKNLPILCEQMPAIVNSGICPCHGAINDLNQEIHQFYPIKDTRIKLPLTINGFPFHKKPEPWLAAIEEKQDFPNNENAHNSARKIFEFFLQFRESEKNKSLLSEALRDIFQYSWSCTIRRGVLTEDGRILPPTN